MERGKGDVLLSAPLVTGAAHLSTCGCDEVGRREARECGKEAFEKAATCLSLAQNGRPVLYRGRPNPVSLDSESKVARPQNDRRASSTDHDAAPDDPALFSAARSRHGRRDGGCNQRPGC